MIATTIAALGSVELIAFALVLLVVLHVMGTALRTGPGAGGPPARRRSDPASDDRPTGSDRHPKPS